MPELLACRVCLATDVKLFSLHKYGLSQSFRTVTGDELPVSDGLPQHLCCYCNALLHRCIHFKNIYLQAQDILNGMALGNQMVTMENLHNIRQKHPKLSTHHPTIHHSTGAFWGANKDLLEMPVKEISFKENLEPFAAIKSEDNCKMEMPEIEIKTEVEEYADAGSPGGSLSNDDDAPLLQLKQSKMNKKRSKHKAARASKKTHFPEDLQIDMVELTKEEQIAEIQARRNSVNYLSAPLKCSHCFKGFLHETTYRNHMDLHDPSAGPHACDVCAARFPTQRQLTRHAKALHACRYVCKLCRHTSNSSYQARLHQKWHEGVTYDCNICEKSFSKLTTHLTHVRVAHRGAHACAQCGAAYLSAHGLRAHALRAHKTRSGESDPAAWCEPCGIQFKNAPALRVHLATSSRHDGTRADMDKHCTMCGESVASDAALRSHQAAHRNSGAVQCSECGVTCKDVRAHSAHYRLAHLGHLQGAGAAAAKQRKFVCELCGTKCASNATLAYHQRTHTGEKPFQCAHCPRRFRLEQHLQIHLRRHTGERPFMCSACPKAFVHKAALNRHVRVHTGAKPYPCGHCGKAFSQSNSLKVHINTVHLKLPQQPRNRRVKPSE